MTRTERIRRNARHELLAGATIASLGAALTVWVIVCLLAGHLFTGGGLGLLAAAQCHVAWGRVANAYHLQQSLKRQVRQEVRL